MPQKLEQCLDSNNAKVRKFYRDARSGIVYHFGLMDGKDMRFSTRIKTDSNVISENDLQKIMRAANKEINARNNKEELGKITPSGSQIIEKIIKRYENAPHPENKKNHTLNTVNSSYRKLDEYFGNMLPHEFASAEAWDEFQDWWDVHYPGMNSENVTKYMRILLGECFEKGYIKRLPKIKDRNKKAQRIKRNKKKDWVYTDEEIIALDEKGCLTDRERIILRFGYQNAFRISDAVTAQWPMIDLEAKVPIYKFQGEDKAETYIGAPLTTDMAELLKRYPKHPGSIYLFPQLKNATRPIHPQMFDFEAIKMRAGVTRGTFHSLRHYRLTKDFKNPAFTTIQVCVLRRVSLKQAMDAYVHVDLRDLELLQNAGALATIKGVKSA